MPPKFYLFAYLKIFLPPKSNRLIVKLSMPKPNKRKMKMNAITSNSNLIKSVEDDEDQEEEEAEENLGMENEDALEIEIEEEHDLSESVADEDVEHHEQEDQELHKPMEDDSIVYDENNNAIKSTTATSTTSSVKHHLLKLKVTPSVSTAYQLATGSQALNNTNLSAIETCLNSEEACNVRNSDLIVCGNCQADFKLENILEFIEHKIHKCSKSAMSATLAAKLNQHFSSKNKSFLKNGSNKPQSDEPSESSDHEQANESEYQGKNLLSKN